MAGLSFALAGCGSGAGGTVAETRDGAAAPVADAAVAATTDDAVAATTDDAVAATTDDAESDADGQAIHGTVVSLTTNRPLAGRTVAISGQRVTTGPEGTFAMGHAPAAYDAYVVDADGSIVSIYRGLTARNLLLPHDGIEDSTAVASVEGGVAGGATYPLGPTGSVTVSIFSNAALASIPISGLLPSGMAGPNFGPVPVSWTGADSIAGQAVTLGSFANADGGAPTSWFATQPVTLTKDQTATIDVTLAPVQTSFHIAGTIVAPSGATVVQKQIFYRFPFPGAIVALPAQSATSAPFDDIVPDLTSQGAQLCVGAGANPGSFVTEICGLTAGLSGFTVTLEPPPSLTAPADMTTVSSSTMFTWSTFAGGIHLLVLQPAAASAATPRIDLFTAETSTVWPSLSDMGVAFPGETSYEVSIEGLGPYASMDDAVGPGGIASTFPAELRRSISESIAVTTR